jgi:hypothetical protein
VWRSLHVCALLGALTMLTSCAFSLAEVSSGYVGCGPDQIEISDYQRGFVAETWRARCGGRVYQCSRSGGGGTMIGRTYVASAPQVACSQAYVSESRPAESPATSTLFKVRKTTGPDREAVFSARLKIAGLWMVLAGAPAKTPGYVTLWLDLPSDLRGKECQVRLMIDGELQPTLRTLQSTRDQLAIMIPLELLERIAGQPRVVGRVCDFEWRLGDKSQAAAKELLMRFREELAWLRRDPASQPAREGAAAP